MELSMNMQRKEFQLLDLLRQRENYESPARTLPHKLLVTDTFISRLGLEKELDGHKGCVNCLEWGESGQVLASASDDMHLILWDPFLYERKLTFHTGHSGNIFSVKFLPKSNESLVITGAGDSDVRIHDVSLSETIFVCHCHTNRVKRIATVETMPSIFWSAAEDGLILQYDIRTRHDCISKDCRNVLVNLVSHAGGNAEAKCMAVNSTKPELVAIGANDPYVRIYDRRMIKFGEIPVEFVTPNNWIRTNQNTAGKGDPENNIPVGCAQYFIAGHLQSSHLKESSRSFATTYLTFSSDGSELLVNMGGEQIYLFDINTKTNQRVFGKKQKFNDTSLKFSELQDQDNNTVESAYGLTSHFVIDATLFNIKELPTKIERLKQEADQKFQQQHYTHAINSYNKAISLCPYAAVLYANRAATLMKRRWDGDIYSALRDCQITLRLDSNNVKAHFRLARCLHDLNRAFEAHRVIEDFRKKFPNYSSNSSYRALKKDIIEAMSMEEHSPHPMLISSHECEWRRSAIDYKLRYCGHCNTTTDIKEVNYFGNSDHYIIAGSDDGSIFIWDRLTTNIVRVLRGDKRIVNCLQPHPTTCLLATSGIDPVIRLWSPLPEDGSINDREIEDFHEVASANQIRMNRDPFKMMMINMGYRLPGELGIEDEGESNESPSVQLTNCRAS